MPPRAAIAHDGTRDVDWGNGVQIVCASCGTVLRRVAGLHYAGEPPTSRDEHGRLIRCLRCGAEYREPPSNGFGTHDEPGSGDNA
jgi:hypothetical protein